MNILVQGGKALVNYDNVASLYVQEVYRQYTHPDKWWEIRAMYTMVSDDIVYDTVATFSNEEDCVKSFKELVRKICERKSSTIAVDN